MTDYLMDIASYQRGINLAVVRAAGFTIANIKTSEGTGYTFSDARAYANAARAQGMRVSLFHYLNGGDTGSAQAAYAWRTAGPIVSDVGPVAFQVDNESNATWDITRDFVHAISDELGHLPYMYTGDWWAASRPGWDAHSLTPWLMAAPNAGYPGTYPGDKSAQWWAGYWGYENLSLMQYAVSPIDGANGGNISKTAIRDPRLWAALTGGTDVALVDETLGKQTISADHATPRNGNEGLSDLVARRLYDIGQKSLAEVGAGPKSPLALAAGLPGRVEIVAGAVADLRAVVDGIQEVVDNIMVTPLSQEAVDAAVRAALNSPSVADGFAEAVANKLAARLAQ